MDMNIKKVQRTIDLALYLNTPQATDEFLERLEFWKQDQGMLNYRDLGGEYLSEDSKELTKLRGFLAVDDGLGRLRGEITLLRRLNYVSIWMTILAYQKEEKSKNEYVAIAKAKRKLLDELNVTEEQIERWERREPKCDLNRSPNRAILFGIMCTRDI
jgi:hypothetical protein